ncbi:MAG: hypothetical protein GKR96_02355 [Gammaproteobacteria bacterium]|nr:hypothetical protein [Gammaproteobacteria bacterium]
MTPLRSPEKVMRLARMGSFHQTRLSFMRALLRYLKKEQWQFKRTEWEIDDKGVGHGIYVASNGQYTYSLVCFAHDLPPEKRSDRVIAEEWDATFALYDGTPTSEEIERLRGNIPKQEAGYCQQTELVLARANRSVRLFEHVVDRLSNGLQPDQDMIDSVGYLMRTSAVYGNGKFGLGDRERVSDRPEFIGAFRTELLAVWLIRAFTTDIVEHMAWVANPHKGVKMDPMLKRRLGVGNSTGLGMAPFLLLHPALIHRWITTREKALARVCGLLSATPETEKQFSDLVRRMIIGVDNWNTVDQTQQNRIIELRQDLLKLQRHIDPENQPNIWQSLKPWKQLIDWTDRELSLEAQELAVSLVIEPHGELVDDLSDEMGIDEAQYFPIQGGQTIGELRTNIEEHYQWALKLDYEEKSESARFWYVSEEKLEPRLGERFDEPGADKEQPLAFGRDVAILYRELAEIDANQKIAVFLLQKPEHRHSVRRVQTTAKLPYAEVQDNLISSIMRPIDLLRCKLSFFGASRFDPRSDRWVRITMYQHAPFPDELYQEGMDVDDWVYPPLPC